MDHQSQRGPYIFTKAGDVLFRKCDWASDTARKVQSTVIFLCCVALLMTIASVLDHGLSISQFQDTFL